MNKKFLIIGVFVLLTLLVGLFLYKTEYKEMPTVSEVVVGETKIINGISVTLDKVVSDSRCPLDVQCIQAGNVVASVTLKSDLNQSTLIVESDGGYYAFEGFNVSILNVEPSPRSDLNIENSAYSIEFQVTK